MEGARQFLAGLSTKARNKVIFNVDRARILNDPRLLKKVNDEIWEFRTEYAGIQYRFLAFWDNRRTAMVVVTHGLVKKSDKLPLSELWRAEKLRQTYLANE